MESMAIEAPMVRYEDALAALAARDERVVVLTAENRAAIRGLPERLGPRFIDVGICEQTMVGAAAGLALRGRRPYVHALAAFLTMRAFEFIRTDVGMGSLPVVLVGYVPGVLSEANGPTHQAIEDVALMRLVPGMNIVCPADRVELAEALEPIRASGRPCYLRFCDREPAVAHRGAFALGEAEILSDGEDVGILTYGFLVGEAQEAARRLEEAGRSVRLVNLRTLAPLDERAVLDTARRTRLLVTVEDHRRVGGLSSIVAEMIARHGRRAALLSLAVGERGFACAKLPGLLEYEGLTGDHIARRISETLST